MKEFVEQIKTAVSKYRMTFGSELELQNHLENIFQFEGMVFAREFVLSPQDRPDFFFGAAGYAIEVKVWGSIDSHLRQVKRYNNHAAVTGTILICTRPFTAPATLSGKPIAIINVGGNRL